MATLLTSSQGSLGAARSKSGLGREEERGSDLGLRSPAQNSAKEREPTRLFGGWGPRKVATPSPKPALWPLKEPSKPKCICAHAQFITFEHMACILTHVSQARKTNRSRGAWARPLSLGLRGCRARAGRVGRQSREPGSGGGRSPKEQSCAAPQPERPLLGSRPRLEKQSGWGSSGSRSPAPAA